MSPSLWGLGHMSPTCPSDKTPLLTSAQRQDTAAVRMAAAVLPACHCRLGTKMSWTRVSKYPWSCLE